jgi:hypothetical protein
VATIADGCAVEGVDADVQRLAVVEHAHFGALAGGRAFARFLLRELLDQRRLLPDSSSSTPSIFGGLIDADAGWYSARDDCRRRVLVGLGRPRPGDPARIASSSGQCFR